MASAAAASIALLLLVSITVCSSASQAARGPAPTPMMMGGGGPAPAPSPALPGNMGCDDALLNVSACLTYVESGSNLTAPDTGCCPALASLVDNQPICLCQLLSSSDAFGIPINTTKALKLPASCRIQTPPLSLCAVAGIPVASPAGSVSPAPASGGPMEPGTASATPTPVAAPPSHSAAGTISGANGLLAAGALFLIAAMFF
ncbi:putative xylogen-like protein 11 [Iris pallida]|uniref:Xylogen-like protein 11 n=1 Tax=Iris pallida TaxID=29817 RepID=A0AAX6E4G4_IRIPA|nr:putative xylogen-like protein 11 [Iris pallida]